MNEYRPSPNWQQKLFQALRNDVHSIDSLIAALEALKASGVPGDTPIVLAKDAEGNGFSPLTRHRGVDHARYLPETEWSGEHYMNEETRQSLDDADDYSPAPADSVPAVFLWPIN